MLWSTKGKREETSGGGGYAERATFHKGLEHFVKYYVFTKNKTKKIKIRKQKYQKRQKNPFVSFSTVPLQPVTSTSADTNMVFYMSFTSSIFGVDDFGEAYLF